MIRKLIREMLLSEKNVFDVTGLQGDYRNDAPPGLDADLQRGAALGYPKDPVTSQYRRDKKKLWNQHADHNFFQDPDKIFVYHALGYYSKKGGLIDYFPLGTTPGNVPGIDIPNKNELSCFGIVRTKMSEFNPVWPYFTFKKYRVTYASRRDAESERLTRASTADLRKHSSSGLPKRPSIRMQNYMMPIDQEEVESYSGGRLEEVIIDNWIIDTFYCKEKDVPYAIKLGLKYKVLGT